VTVAIVTRVRKWSSTFRVEIRTRISSAGRRIGDWISGAWERVHDAVLSAFGRLYRPLYWYRDHYEHFEPLIIFVELVLIFYGLEVTYQQEIIPLDVHIKDLTDWSFYRHFFNLGHSKDLGDFCIFLVLFISGTSRLLIAARGHSLGYAYTEIGRLLHGTLDIDDVYARVRRAPWGSAPAGKNDAKALANYADTIANRTSALLSLRTYHLRDTQWLTRDHDSLLDWFTIFPAALWRLVPDDKSDEVEPPIAANESGGYYSVVVPTTAASAKHICRGQKATDLAEVDPKIADAFGKQPIDLSGLNAVEFLAYVQLHVPRYRRERLADELLFATSIQHIVFLLHGIFGAAGNFRANWNFVIFCEAANSRHGRVLERFGFVGLEGRAHERSEEPTGPGKSYAGFPLFELKVMSGQPCPDPKNPKAEISKAYAEKFVRFLEDLTVIYRDRTEHRAS
jgi:hypothetical protein